MQADGDLAAEVATIQWYHTMELRPGVVTPGYLDTRPVVERLPLPPLTRRPAASMWPPSRVLGLRDGAPRG